MTTTPSDTDASVEKCLILGHGFHEDERSKVCEILHKIDHRLHGIPAENAKLEIGVKDRDGKDQKVTLEAGVGKAHLVATAEDEDVWAAVAHVREEFLRLYNDWADKRKR
ncbi:MAG: HPF/RaiA family ribosome-associated protein [Actinomycetia bacterium]|nr:HPF/RaiA family ribosome-associated protein [Actinomycetes bacterium]